MYVCTYVHTYIFMYVCMYVRTASQEIINRATSVSSLYRHRASSKHKRVNQTSWLSIKAAWNLALKLNLVQNTLSHVLSRPLWCGSD